MLVVEGISYMRQFTVSGQTRCDGHWLRPVRTWKLACINACTRMINDHDHISDHRHFIIKLNIQQLCGCERKMFLSFARQTAAQTGNFEFDVCLCAMHKMKVHFWSWVIYTSYAFLLHASSFLLHSTQTQWEKETIIILIDKKKTYFYIFREITVVFLSSSSSLII